MSGSAALRTGAALALLNLVCLSLSVTVLSVAVRERIERRVEGAIEDRHETIARLLAERGRAGLWPAIDIELPMSALHGIAFERLDAAGRHVDGNVRGLGCDEGWHDALLVGGDGASALPVRAVDRARSGGQTERFRFLSSRLDGGCLSVGRSLDERDAVTASSVALLPWAVSVCLLPSLLVSAVVARRNRARLQRIDDTLARVADGTLTERVPVTGDDEIDALARGVNRSIARLQNSVEALQQLSSTVAHDLRAPLARLALPLERAVEANRSGRPDVAALDEVIAGTRGLRETFDALLSISRIESGSGRARFAALCLVELAASIHEIYAPVCEEAGMRLVPATISVQSIDVRGDRGLLQQAVVNLIENAIRHCPVGTTIRLEAVRVDGAAELVVTDDGPGIPPAERERVFRRLYRLEGRAGAGGTGLGLALVHAVAELHGATVTLHDAAPGLGARLRFADTREGDGHA